VNDDGDVTMIDARTTNAELTYQADFNLIATYPNLGLTLTEIRQARGVCNLLNAQQLSRLNQKLAGKPVQSWQTVWMPNTRANFRGQLMRIPRAIQGFSYIPSGEVFHDWVWQNDGHGQSAAAMEQALGPHSKLIQLFGPFDEQYDQQRDRTVYTHRNFTCQIVISGRTGDHGRTLITYYSTQ
jgi:hypothetical protein